jgi:hypothetical protein
MAATGHQLRFSKQKISSYIKYNQEMPLTQVGDWGRPDNAADVGIVFRLSLGSLPHLNCLIPGG